MSVEKDYLVFASAHFITFAGHRCEGLHGHNYRARVTVEGALNEEAWFVFDFVELKKIMRKLCDEIDHLVLLPTESSRIKVEEKGETVTVGVDGKPRYVFPRKDCALLPIPNTTVEMLAQLLATRLGGELDARGRARADRDRNGSGGELRAVRRLSRDAQRSVMKRARDERAGASHIGKPHQIGGAADASAGEQRRVRHRSAYARQQLEIRACRATHARKVDHDHAHPPPRRPRAPRALRRAHHAGS